VVDLTVVRERLRAYHGTPIPLSIARFVAWLAADPTHIEQLSSAAFLYPAWDLSIADGTAPLPVRPTQRYGREPPEFIAIARTGVDGEEIGVLELAPELERGELPFVTFFPMEFGAEVCELGADFAGALAMYLAYPSAEGARPLRLLGLAEGNAPAAVWNGFLPHAEAPPSGYRFVQTHDRTGVLAPSGAFGADDSSLEAPLELSALDAAAGRAERALREGYPGTAIAAARNVRYATGGYHEAAVDRACLVWAAAALQLGRPWHAQMVAEAQQSYAPPSTVVISETAVVWEDEP
jgi:hypothetical protein